MSEYKVGQKLWYVPSDSRRGPGREVTISAIGRKWAVLDNGVYRFDINTGRVDGGQYSSPGVVYKDEQTYLTFKEAQEAWDKLRYEMSYYLPNGVTKENILSAAKLLGMGDI